MSVITEFQEDDINSNIKLFYINKMDKLIDSTFLNNNPNILRSFDGKGQKQKLHPNVYVFGEAIYNDDANSWYTYLPGIKTVSFGPSLDIITNISTLTNNLITTQPLNSTNIIAYSLADSNRSEKLFIYETFYFQALMGAYLTCCMPTNNLKYATQLTKTGVWGPPNMTNALYVGTNYDNVLICNTASVSLEYDFTNIKYCAIAFAENPNANDAFWDIYINNVLQSSYRRSIALTSPSSKAVTLIEIVDCGAVGNYNIKVTSTDTTVKGIFWFCGWNIADAAALGKPTIVCSIPRVDTNLFIPATTYKNILYTEKIMFEVVVKLQSMGLPITYFNWSTTDGMFNNAYYKPSPLKYKRMANDLLQYALL